MTNKQFLLCVSECGNYLSREEYVSDLAQSSMWDDAPETLIPQERLEALEKIWDAVNRNIKDIASESGMSQRKLAERFCIPYRTMEDWCAEKRECKLYDRLMMQECLGLLQR